MAGEVNRQVKQTFLMIAGVITALLLPALVFIPSMELKLAAFVGILVVASGIAALAVKLRKKS
jgi:uncharacterized membrane protein HdeD (DUF308 family)